MLASGDGDFDLLAVKSQNDLNALVEVYGVAEFSSTSPTSAASKKSRLAGVYYWMRRKDKKHS